MAIRRKDFQKAAATLHQLQKKLAGNHDCAELRDSVNLTLLHMQNYYKILQSRLQQWEETGDGKLATTLRGLSPMTPFRDSPNKLDWKWVNLENVRLQESMGRSTGSLHIVPKVLQSIKEGDVDQVRRILKNDVNECIECDGLGRTALMYAVNFKQTEIMDVLWKYHCDVNAQAMDGTTAVHRACYNSDVHSLQWLINNGAALNLADQQGRYPLHWAATNANSRLLQLLIEDDSDPNVRDSEGMSAAMWACRVDNFSNFKTLSSLSNFELDDDGFERDCEGRTWLHWSVRTVEPLVCLETMLSRNTIEMVDNEGRTVVHTAAEAGSLVALKKIIEVGGHECLRQRDNLGRTPLIHATMHGHGEVVNYILSQGGDLLAIDSTGASAWDYACARKLNYCMLIIASYLRLQMRNKSEHVNGAADAELQMTPRPPSRGLNQSGSLSPRKRLASSITSRKDTHQDVPTVNDMQSQVRIGSPTESIEKFEPEAVSVASVDSCGGDSYERRDTNRPDGAEAEEVSIDNMDVSDLDDDTAQTQIKRPTHLTPLDEGVSPCSKKSRKKKKLERSLELGEFSLTQSGTWADTSELLSSSLRKKNSDETLQSSSLLASPRMTSREQKSNHPEDPFLKREKMKNNNKSPRKEERMPKSHRIPSKAFPTF